MTKPSRRPPGDPVPFETVTEPTPILWSPQKAREGGTSEKSVIVSLDDLPAIPCSAPVLDLTDGQGSLSSFALATLRAVMIYPSSVEAQNGLLARLKTRIGGELQREWHQEASAQRAVEDWTVREINRHGGFSALVHGDEDMATREQRGEIAGRLLWRIFSLTYSKPPASVNKAIFLLACRHSEWRERTIRAAWSEYKASAHLWAAWVTWWDSFRAWKQHPEGEDPETLSPYKSDTLPAFLSVAEMFRRFGCKFRPSGSRQPILDLAGTWQLPSDLHLPSDIALQLPPLDSWTITTLGQYRNLQRAQK